MYHVTDSYGKDYGYYACPYEASKIPVTPGAIRVVTKVSQRAT